MFGNYAQYPISGNTPQGGVAKAIQNASAETGVDFGYLVQQAKVESGMNPTAKAKTSSATGLYQFIEQTWLRVMKTHGAEHGYGRYADAIKQKPNGSMTVSSPALRNEILNMRKDPKAASLMAAELATENHDYLQSTTGKTPGKTELYMAHFLGAGGASNFLKSMQKNPWAPAASLFPEAARSNRGVFYAQGRPLTLQQVYNRFDAKFDGGGDAPVIQTARNEGKSLMEQYTGVKLPDADSWSAPVRSERFSGNNRTAGSLKALYAPVPQQGPAPTVVQQVVETKPADRIPGGFLSSPVDVMFIANRSRMEHNNNDRYNA